MMALSRRPLMLLAGLLVLPACHNTREGVERDAEIAGQRAQEQADKLEVQVERGAVKAQEVGSEVAADVKEGAQDVAGDVREGAAQVAQASSELADTAGLRAAAAKRTFDVKTALLADARVDASRIDVDSEFELKIVHLRGAVSTQAEKDIAETIAREQASAWTVSNELVVKAK